VPVNAHLVIIFYDLAEEANGVPIDWFPCPLLVALHMSAFRGKADIA
jgi:hypothetical protein